MHGHVRLIIGIMLWLGLIVMNMPVLAQTASAPAFDQPDISASQITTDLQAVRSNDDLTDEQKTTAIDQLNRSRTALEGAARNINIGDRFRDNLESFIPRMAELQNEIDELRLGGSQMTDDPDEVMTDENLLKIQQDLFAKEGQLRTLQSEIDRYKNEIQAMVTRPLTVNQELTEARDFLATLASQLADLNAVELDDLQTIRQSSLQAQRYFRQTQIYALEQERAGLSARQQIITARRNLAELKAKRVEADVKILQNKTGFRRMLEARRLETESIAALGALESSHPLIKSYATDNINLTQDLKKIAALISAHPVKEAGTRRQLDTVENGVAIAQELVDLGNLNRQSSATLRQLRAKTPAIPTLKGELADTRKQVNTAIQERLLLQERLRNFPVGSINIDATFDQWKNINPDAASLSEDDRLVLRGLSEKRRQLLTAISDAAQTHVTNTTTLQSLQSELVIKTEALTETLNENLLWLPSVEPISLQWPITVFRGFSKTFTAANLLAGQESLVIEARDQLPIVLIFILIIIALLLSRARLLSFIHAQAKDVGRVQHDTYWHTPSVILACLVRALPIPLFLFVLSLLFAFSTDPNPFVQALADVTFYLAIFTMFFLTLREWDSDKSLFDEHFKFPESIRRAINKELLWFVPATGLAISLIIIGVDDRDPDIYGGVALFAFIVTCLLLAVFSFKVIWQNRNTLQSALDTEGFLWRHRQTISALLIGVPTIAAIAAAMGYLDTANDIMNRIFFSGQLVVGTYVTYGVIRRTVQLAQRRFSLRQAMERRELAIQARKEKEAAEELGEEEQVPPPQIDYNRIDIETISRQTSQLLFTIIAVGFAALMWLVWQDLLPALGVFDRVEIGHYMVDGVDGLKEAVPITLWNLIQSIFILVFSVLAAKNLPGFLEIFLLNRTSLEPGTKYAIKTVLGYIIIVVGILMAFDRLGTQWAQLQWIVAALGVGIGFGLQEIIANFISGLIILFERPVRVGDYITIGDQSGTVSRIQIRATTLADLDNREILIPNKELITGRVTNWTLSNSTTRMILTVGIAYGSDTDKAREIMLDALRNNPKVLENPAPNVLFTGFGDSSLDFQLRVFLKNFDDRWPVTHVIHTDINKDPASCVSTAAFSSSV